MNKQTITSIESWLPVFTGFYNTLFEFDDTSLIESEVEYMKDELGYHRIPDGCLYDLFEFDYEGYSEAVAKECCEAVHMALSEVFGDSLTVVFQAVESPREYNFKNDGINVEYQFTSDFVKKLSDYLEKNRDAFIQDLKDTYSSRSGFMSFYSNDIEDWQVETIHDDNHRLGSFLEFVLSNEGYDSDSLYDAVEPHNFTHEYGCIKLPEFDELPETTQKTLNDIDETINKGADQVTEYCNLKPEFAEKANKQHYEKTVELEGLYLETLVDYVNSL